MEQLISPFYDACDVPAWARASKSADRRLVVLNRCLRPVSSGKKLTKWVSRKSKVIIWSETTSGEFYLMPSLNLRWKYRLRHVVMWMNVYVVIAQFIANDFVAQRNFTLQYRPMQIFETLQRTQAKVNAPMYGRRTLEHCRHCFVKQCSIWLDCLLPCVII